MRMISQNADGEIRALQGKEHITTCLKGLGQTLSGGNATEQTCRPALHTLLEQILQDLKVIDEPRRIACGAPDYVLTRSGIPLGCMKTRPVPTN